MKSYYVYILRCEDNSLYTGITTDVERRFSEHLGKNGKGAKYTKVHKPVKIEKVFSCCDRAEASKLEYKIKKMTKEQKENLIKTHI
jgi:putative endonuclease